MLFQNSKHVFQCPVGREQPSDGGELATRWTAELFQCPVGREQSSDPWYQLFILLKVEFQCPVGREQSSDYVTLLVIDNFMLSSQSFDELYANGLPHYCKFLVTTSQRDLGKRVSDISELEIDDAPDIYNAHRHPIDFRKGEREGSNDPVDKIKDLVQRGGRWVLFVQRAAELAQREQLAIERLLQRIKDTDAKDEDVVVHTFYKLLAELLTPYLEDDLFRLILLSMGVLQSTSILDDLLELTVKNYPAHKIRSSIGTLVSQRIINREDDRSQRTFTSHLKIDDFLADYLKQAGDVQVIKDNFDGLADYVEQNIESDKHLGICWKYFYVMTKQAYNQAEPLDADIAKSINRLMLDFWEKSRFLERHTYLKNEIQNMFDVVIEITNKDHLSADSQYWLDHISHRKNYANFLEMQYKLETIEQALQILEELIADDRVQHNKILLSRLMLNKVNCMVQSESISGLDEVNAYKEAYTVLCQDKQYKQAIRDADDVDEKIWIATLVYSINTSHEWYAYSLPDEKSINEEDEVRSVYKLLIRELGRKITKATPLQLKQVNILQAKVYNGYGYVLCDSKEIDLEKAREQFNNALKLSRQYADYYHEGTYLNSILYVLDQLDKSEAVFDEAYEYIFGDGTNKKYTDGVDSIEWLATPVYGSLATNQYSGNYRELRELLGLMFSFAQYGLTIDKTEAVNHIKEIALEIIPDIAKYIGYDLDDLEDQFGDLE